MKEKRLSIIADDLTGAMDSSGYFATMGLITVVVLDQNPSRIAEVMVISTDSRGDDPDTASHKVRKLASGLKDDIVYKKIDSTLRGNISIELAGVMDSLSSEKVIVAPAFPAVGRTTVNGMLLVNNTPVSETQFANDPISPVTESHIPRMLKQSIGQPIGMVSLESVNAGAKSLYHELANRSERILVCDAVEQSHLHTIACASAMAGGNWLLCGSAGLARELCNLPDKKAKAKSMKVPTDTRGAALLAVGSRHQMSATQLRKAQNELDIPILELNIGLPAGSQTNATEMDRILLEARALLRQGKTVAVTSTFSQYVPALKRSVAGILAELVADILSIQDVSGLFLCGGDTALELCRRLNIGAIDVQGEVETGVPAGKFSDSRGNYTRVVTKAGGFGSEGAIMKAISYLERGYLS